MSEILRRLSRTKKKQIPKVLFRFQPWSSNYSFTGNRLGCALAFALALALEVICLKINISAPFVWFYSELFLPLFLTQSLLYFSISADYRRCSTIPHPIPLQLIPVHCTSSQSLFQYLFLFWNDTPPNPRALILFQWTITTRKSSMPLLTWSITRRIKASSKKCMVTVARAMKWSNSPHPYALLVRMKDNEISPKVDSGVTTISPYR